MTFSPSGGNTACVNMTILPDNAVESGKRFALLLDLAGSSQFLRLGSQANTTVIIVGEKWTSLCCLHGLYYLRTHKEW